MMMMTVLVNGAALGSLLSSWEMHVTLTRPVNRNMCMTRWDNPRLPSMVDVDALQYKCDHWQKIIYSWSQRAICLIPTRGPLQAAHGQVQGQECARLWWHLLRVVLPPLTRDVRPELRPVGILIAQQLHATDQPGLGRELGAL